MAAARVWDRGFPLVGLRRGGLFGLVAVGVLDWWLWECWTFISPWLQKWKVAGTRQDFLRL
jgi:hypothetical protein